MKLWRILVAVLVLALTGAAFVFGVSDLSPRPERIPTVRPTRGDVDVKIHTRGELGPRRSMTLAAPSIGGTLQIVTLSAAGTVVRKGDLVLAFDRAEQDYNLQQAESELAEAEQEIVKLQADGRVQAFQDQLNLLHARHELSRAEIEVSGNEFVGRIDAEKNKLALEEARRNLAQLEGDVATHAESNRAALAVLQQKRGKAKIAADFARRNIENMAVTAPLDGLVVLKENQNASGGFGFPGMSLPEYRIGDTVQPGQTVAEIVDITEMEVRATVGDTERSAVDSGVPARVEVEALPLEPFEGSAKGVGGLAQRAFWEPQTTPQFAARFGLAHPSSVLRPGITALVVVDGGKLRDVLHLPRQVLFEKDGQPIVYVRHGPGFVARPVKVVRITESRVVLQDLPADADVALVDPEAVDQHAAGGGDGASSSLPGGAR